MGVLRTIFWILLGYYLLKLVSRLLRPWAHAYARKKSEELFRQAAERQGGKPHSAHREGEVIIDKKPPARKSSGKKVGEYIEFEEIE
jgi:hypothetical protein